MCNWHLKFNIFKTKLICTPPSNLLPLQYSVQSFSLLQLFATPWTAACQASLSITSSQSLLKLVFIESVMPSNHLILCRPLLLPPSIFPSITVFSVSEWQFCSSRPENILVSFLLAVPGLCCCPRAFSSWGEWELLSSLRWLLVEHGL